MLQREVESLRMARQDALNPNKPGYVCQARGAIVRWSDHLEDRPGVIRVLPSPGITAYMKRMDVSNIGGVGGGIADLEHPETYVFSNTTWCSRNTSNDGLAFPSK